LQQRAERIIIATAAAGIGAVIVLVHAAGDRRAMCAQSWKK